MKDVNKVILVGRLGADPIQRHTKTGYPVAHFALATSRRIYRENNTSNVAQITSSESTEGTTNGASPLAHSVNSVPANRVMGTPTEETQWHQVVAWGKQGEACARYLRKGHSVYVEGMIRSRQWETKEGVQKTSFEIHSDNISFLGWPKGEARSEVERAG